MEATSLKHKHKEAIYRNDETRSSVSEMNYEGAAKECTKISLEFGLEQWK